MEELLSIQYSADDCRPVSDSRPRRLRSSDYCRVSFDVHTTRTVTDALPLQGRGSGTLCRLNCNNVALSDNLNGVWRLSIRVVGLRRFV